MKRLIPLILLAIAFGCKPEQKPANPGNGDNNNNDPEETAIVSLNSIIVEGSYDFAEDAGEKKIPVSLQPSIGKVSRDVEVSCQQNGNLDYSLLDDGIMVTPRKKGKAVFSLMPRAGKASEKTITVNILEKEPELMDVWINTNLDNYSDGVLIVSYPGKGQLEACVMNEFENLAVVELNWEVTSGKDVISVDASSGEVTALKPGNAEVKVTVVSKPELTATGKVKVVPKPTAVYIDGHGESGEFTEELKPGGTMSLNVRIYPVEAFQDFDVVVTAESGANPACELTHSTSPNGQYTTLTLKFNGTPDIKYRAVKIISKAEHSVSRTCKFYCFDYFSDEIKIGDYVYCKSSDKTVFRAEDCGRRTKDGQYLDGKAKTPPSVSGYEYIGVIASFDLPLDDDFLKASMLSDVSDPKHKNISGFRKSNLSGFENFPGRHALVISKNHSSPMKWQSSPVAIVSDKSVNAYHLNPLNGVLAFSQEEKDAGLGTTYIKYGFLSSRIIIRYTGLQNTENKKVLPADYVYNLETSFDPTTSDSGKSSTGWFIPGKGEFELLGADLGWLESLNSSGSDPWDVSGLHYYWLIEEAGAGKAKTMVLSLSNLTGEISKIVGNSIKNPSSDQPRVRPVLYL
ncbi:MAG: hypothetical protein IKR69_01020 [Bacteroidales bacterium]|nr:hypothetical protein [Bacteroidales bacterium]